MNKKISILNEYFSPALLHYSYLFLKDYMSHNIFTGKKSLHLISTTWFRKVPNLIKKHNLNYNAFNYKRVQINEYNYESLKKFKTKIIEMSYLILLVPYFPQISLKSSYLKKLVRISIKR